ncbi:hypothetical protein VTH06DRAFT_7407 [Thermothelomyces fergusii]
MEAESAAALAATVGSLLTPTTYALRTCCLTIATTLQARGTDIESAEDCCSPCHPNPPIRIHPVFSSPHHDSSPEMSAQNSAGIQTLLDAEREASKIVQKAREYRTKRVREARDEAKKEIEEYRAKKEAEYKAFEAEHTQGNKQAEEEANREAEAKIAEIQEAGKKNQDKIVKDLLAAVYQAHPTPAS